MSIMAIGLSFIVMSATSSSLRALSCRWCWTSGRLLAKRARCWSMCRRLSRLNLYILWVGLCW